MTVPDQHGKAEEFAAEAVKYLGQEGRAGPAAVWAALAVVVGVPGRPGLNDGHRSSLRPLLNSCLRRGMNCGLNQSQETAKARD